MSSREEWRDYVIHYAKILTLERSDLQVHVQGDILIITLIEGDWKVGHSLNYLQLSLAREPIVILDRVFSNLTRQLLNRGKKH